MKKITGTFFTAHTVFSVLCSRPPLGGHRAVIDPLILVYFFWIIKTDHCPTRQVTESRKVLWTWPQGAGKPNFAITHLGSFFNANHRKGLEGCRPSALSATKRGGPH
jgi:hypothetical protein